MLLYMVVCEHLRMPLLIPDYSSLLKVDLGAYRHFHSLIKDLEKLVPTHTFKVT